MYTRCSVNKCATCDSLGERAECVYHVHKPPLNFLAWRRHSVTPLVYIPYTTTPFNCISVRASAGDFRDAIASLSPEQAEFARAARAVQLQSTLFGVLVIQIKPHLEAVLNLPPESLTKEVELTQALMDLFIQYQIPAGGWSIIELCACVVLYARSFFQM